MPVAACRLTGSVSGFHDPSLVSVMVHVTPDAPQAVHRTAARLPSMARERMCWAPWTGPTNGRRVSRVISYLCSSPTGSAVPQALLRADRPGHAHPQPGARRSSTWSVAFRARLRSCQRAPSPRRPCRGPRATCHPWRQGGSHRWRSPRIRRDTAPAAGRPRELRSPHTHRSARR